MAHTQNIGLWASSPDLLERIKKEVARGNLRFIPNYTTRTPRPTRRKQLNQQAKARRRAIVGKPSYRQRQASARAAKAQRAKPRLVATGSLAD